jgi:hypothetical protein
MITKIAMMIMMIMMVVVMVAVVAMTMAGMTYHFMKKFSICSMKPYAHRFPKRN